jgi:hypothetical protein
LFQIDHICEVNFSVFHSERVRGRIVMLLLSVFLLPYMSSQTWLLLRRIAVKHRMQREVLLATEREGLVHLSFTRKAAKQQLRWEHNREFEYGGKMFDVVETEVSDGMVHYWCIADEEETSLNGLLEELLAFATATDQAHHPGGNASIDFYAALFLQVIDEARFVAEASEPEYGFEQTTGFFRFLQSPDTPPPDLG